MRRGHSSRIRVPIRKYKVKLHNMTNPRSNHYVQQLCKILRKLTKNSLPNLRRGSLPNPSPLKGNVINLVRAAVIP